MSEYNRKYNGQFDTPDRVEYQCDKVQPDGSVCGHLHEGFEIMGMKIVCPKCGDSFVIGVDDK